MSILTQPLAQHSDGENDTLLRVQRAPTPSKATTLVAYQNGVKRQRRFDRHPGRHGDRPLHHGLRPPPRLIPGSTNQ